VYGVSEDLVRQRRLDEGLVPAYKRIDTCAAEFESFTPYMYSTYEQVCERTHTEKEGCHSGQRAETGSGRASSSTICCCHAVYGFRDEGFETVMVNCNPETVLNRLRHADRLISSR
jgi:carbamoyl-phosphate synthase large subunit